MFTRKRNLQTSPDWQFSAYANYRVDDFKRSDYQNLSNEDTVFVTEDRRTFIASQSASELTILFYALTWLLSKHSEPFKPYSVDDEITQYNLKASSP